VHAYEIHAHEVYACEVHVHEVYAYEVHAYKMHTHDVHAYEIRAKKAADSIRYDDRQRLGGGRGKLKEQNSTTKRPINIWKAAKTADDHYCH
jgi:hypothetical protein